MGHGIGLDVHEQPFISTENDTPLEPGMTFTDEPSIRWDGHFAVRIEDIVVGAEEGGEYLNRLDCARDHSRKSRLPVYVLPATPQLRALVLSTRHY